MMGRYHINPETGNANLCRAKVRCRFQREGEPPVAHYATKEEAQAAYERQQRKAQEGVTYGLTSSLRKKVSASVGFPPLTPEKEKQLVKEADEVLSEFVDADGYFNLPPQDEPWEPRGFTYLASGEYSNVYLSPDKTMVYKIANNASAPNDAFAIDTVEREEASVAYVKELVRDYQENYAALATDLLAEKGAEVVPTYFIPALTTWDQEVTVIAQPYLPEEEYETFINPDSSGEDDGYVQDEHGKFHPLSREEWEARGFGIHPHDVKAYYKLGLQDIHQGNYKRRKKDGVLVFFDCV